MEPKIHKTRTTDSGDKIQYRDINDTAYDVLTDEFYNEDGDYGFVDDTEETQEYIEDLRIESLKRAIDIAKLMSNVTTEDIIKLAGKLVKFIRDTKI